MKISTLILFCFCIQTISLCQSQKELFDTGYKFLSKGNNTQAIIYFTEALNLDNNYSDAYYNRGVSYMRTGEYKNALKDFNWVIKYSGVDSLQYRSYGNNAYI